MGHRVVGILLLVAVTGSVRAAGAPDFDRDVLPVLKRHCTGCHGDKKKRAGLDLRTAAGLLVGGESGPVLVRGSAAKSVLFEKVEGRTMPPPEKQDRLTEQEVVILRRWIDGGAHAAAAPVAALMPKDRVVTAQDRAYWAFRKPVAPAVPRVKARNRVRTPVDAFLLARLETKGLGFSPDADRLTLLRRAYLDLLGLPPSPEELRSFLADPRPDAYERLIDRLFASPQYGERWGRHWLDVAGYTDNPHYTADKAGAIIPFEDWRYRDYVVRAFNQDKPYDRFMTEQLAGDELVAWRSADAYTPEMLDALVATGYLRTTPDWTHSDEFPAYRHDTLARVVENVSTGLFGLTMGCVRCHAHKFDPIPAADFYRLVAIFATAYNTDDWLRPVDRYVADVPPGVKAEVDRHNAQIDVRLAEIKKQLDDLRDRRRKEVRAARLAKLPAEIRADVEKAVVTPPARRDQVQRYLAGKFEALLTKFSDQDLKLSAAETAQAGRLANEFSSLLTKKKSFARLQVLFDVGKPPVVHQLIRGDPRTPGQVVQPGFPTVLCPPGRSTAVRPPDTKGHSSGRRLALARWLTGPDHPLTARVMVNRIWQHHFGKGIVATPENFGHSGSPPTHPELLDWLAVDFREHGWSVKRMHRLLMTSTAYRQSARRPAEGESSLARTADPDNDLLWRMNLRRLEAEALRDTVLAVSGKLDRTMGRPPVPVVSNADGLVTVADVGPTLTSRWRRSLYVRSLRGSHASGQGFKLSLFEIFDYPEMAINCTRRANSTTPLQSLALLNSKFILEQSRHFAERVRRLAGDDRPSDQVERAFLLALGRTPTADELHTCVNFLQTQRAWCGDSKTTAEQAAQQALASLCSILLASNEFLYVG